MKLNKNKWIVTERFNVFIFLGVMLIILVFIPSKHASGFGWGLIVSGLAMNIFYKWEYIEKQPKAL